MNKISKGIRNFARSLPLFEEVFQKFPLVTIMKDLFLIRNENASISGDLEIMRAI